MEFWRWCIIVKITSLVGMRLVYHSKWNMSLGNSICARFGLLTAALLNIQMYWDDDVSVGEYLATFRSLTQGWLHDHEDGLRYFETPVTTSFRLLVSQLFCSSGVVGGNRGIWGKDRKCYHTENNETGTLEERTNNENCQLVFTVAHAVGRCF